MATAPAIEPQARSYSFGGEPVAEFESVAFLLGIDPVGLTMNLTFLALTPARVALFHAHYEGQRGGVRPFDLPAEQYRGHASQYDVLPSGQRWRYAGPISEPAAVAGLVDLSVSYISALD
jgi:hypothetical protein